MPKGVLKINKKLKNKEILPFAVKLSQETTNLSTVWNMRTRFFVFLSFVVLTQRHPDSRYCFEVDFLINYYLFRHRKYIQNIIAFITFTCTMNRLVSIFIFVILYHELYVY